VFPLLIAVLVVLAALDGGASSLAERSLAAILVWWAILVAAAASLWPAAAIPRAALLTGGLLVAYGALAGLSSLWSASAEAALLEMNRVLLYAGVLAVGVLAARTGEAGRWVAGLGAGIAVVAGLALAQRLFPGLLPEGDLATLLPDASTRLAYPVGYWNALGMFLGLGVPLLLAVATATDHPLARAAAVAPLPAIAGAIYLTSSRGGVSVALIGAVVFLALTARRFAGLQSLGAAGAGAIIAIAVLKARPAVVDGPFDTSAAETQGAEAALLVLLACALAAALAAAPAAVLPPRLHVPRHVVAVTAAVVAAAGLVALVASDPAERYRNFKAPPPSDAAPRPDSAVDSHLLSGAGSGRWQFWSASVDQFGEHPIAGDGAGSYAAWWAQHGELDWFVRNAHSQWFETLGELGLLGLALFLAVFATALWTGARRLRGRTEADRVPLAAAMAAVVAFAAGTAADWVWHIPAFAFLGMLALGLLVGPATLPRQGRAEERAARLAFGPRAALVVVAWAVVCLNAMPLLAGEELDASRRDAGRGDLDEALDHARSARAIQPWAAGPYLQLALLYEERGDLPRARARIADALGKDESDWRLHLTAARLATKDGDVPAAARALREARRLSPRSRVLRGLAEP
jgi:hypothetical protein